MLLQVWMCYSSAVQDVQLFDQANTLYAQGSYDSALVDYQKISNKTGLGIENRKRR